MNEIIDEFASRSSSSIDCRKYKEERKRNSMSENSSNSEKIDNLIEELSYKESEHKEKYSDNKETKDLDNKSDSLLEDFNEESADYVEDYEDIEENIGEGKNYGNEGETSLEFEEYGIKLNQ